MKRLAPPKLLIPAVALLAVAAVCTACAGLLEGENSFETLHPILEYERPQEEQIEIASYEQLLTELMALIMRHEESGRMYAYNYSGDIAFDIQRACWKLMRDDAVVVYAVEDISGVASRIVSYYEIDITVVYKHTKQQIDSIVNASTLRYLKAELLSIISENSEEAVIRTSRDITEDDIIELVKETYYENPRMVVMMPVTVLETFTTSGADKIFELRFGYIEQAGILRQHGANLSVYVRRNAEQAVGETDAEILLSLANNLIAACIYDEGTARAISVHGAQNFAATAYGALVNGSAVGEGFAMAFKALCDELGFECHVVLGYLNGMVHAWNIVPLYGENYHIDVAMCALNGIETAFLKNDADFLRSYSWNTEKTVSCKGTLTYEDIVGPEEEDVNPDDAEGGIVGESDGEAGEASEASEETGDEAPVTSDGSDDQTDEELRGRG